MKNTWKLYLDIHKKNKDGACGKSNVEFKQGKAINSISPDWQIELVIPTPHLSSAAFLYYTILYYSPHLSSAANTIP